MSDRANLPTIGLFAPGEPVAESGLYSALHRRKRTNRLLLVRGQVFPSCQCCGRSVRFALTIRGPHITEDADFRQHHTTAAKVILCVCNDPAKLLCRALLLLRGGFTVFQAANNKAAVRMLGHCWPDCILLEYTPRTARNGILIKQQCASLKVFLASGGYVIPARLEQALDAVIDSSDAANLLSQLRHLLLGEQLAVAS